MEKYEVVSVIGEGSFGRVYKARVLDSNKFVALKLIVKKGRTAKEIEGFNQECEILRKLQHPNIIPMLDSFETENEIVVITEFVDRELYEILGQEGYLPEEQVRKITCDLISALFYLHSNRVLHRDLKPQNILLDHNGVAKLCDFGFARCMGISTHVLTSIKGTPLYMAPELIDGRPYDHTADLWSLGCIVYELLVGSPPFSTSSILQLVQLIQHETVQWPEFISSECRHFLEGLLQKRPEKRMSWQTLLAHSFLKNGVRIVETSNLNPFTLDLTESQSKAKQAQTLELLTRKNSLYCVPKPPLEKTSSCPSETKAVDPVAEQDKGHSSLKSFQSTDVNNIIDDMNNLVMEEDSKEKEASRKKSGQVFTLHSWDSAASARPIENDEWMAFLQRNMEEIMAGQLDCLSNSNLASVVVAPLRNSNASCRVLEYVATMLSLPFVVDGPPEKDFDIIKQVYLEIKVIPNLIYASKIIARNRGYDSEGSTPPVPSGSELLIKPVSDLSADELQTLETIYLLVCHLVHSGEDFLLQFCDAVALLNNAPLIQQFLLLGRRKVRIVTDLLAVLNLICRDLPKNLEVVEHIVLGVSPSGRQGVDFSRLLAHPSGVVRSRTCDLIRQLSKHRAKAFQAVINPRLEQDLLALRTDSVSSVRKAAEDAYNGIRPLIGTNIS